MKILKAIKSFFISIWKFFDKMIILPITKLIYRITSRNPNSGRRFENWLSSTNALLFVSLILALTIFILIDQQK